VPIVGVTDLAASSVTLTVQPWVSVTDFLLARAELYQAIIEKFRDTKIDIPFPQSEVRLLRSA